tara:strand:+ start:561 stop:1145 length:585 start_codon:yes stop_codon:yes gene_type:complete
MDSHYIVQSFLIIIIFGLLQLTNLFAVGVKHIKNNWSLYRCNPLIIPFAGLFGHDPQETFTYCAHNYNMNFMQYLMDPLKWMVGNIGNIGKDVSDTVGDIVNLGSSTNSGIFSVFTNIYGTATNVLAQFQIIVLGLKDTFSKIVGILITFLYLLKGIEYAVPSALLTPPGKAIIWIINTLGTTACDVFMPGGCG